MTRGSRIWWIGTLFVLGIGAFVGALVEVGGRGLSGGGTPTPYGPIMVGPFSVPAEALDFGIVWAHRDFKWSVPITNTLDRAVDISDVIPMCGCAITDRKPFSLRPGETAEVKLKIDLTSKRPETDAQLERHFPVGVMLLSNAENAREIRLNVQGTVRDAFYLWPPVVRISEISEGTVETPTAFAKLRCFASIKKLTAKCDESALEVCIGEREQSRTLDGTGPRTSFPIKVAVKKRLGCGEHVFDVTLLGVTANGEELPGFRFRVVASVVGDVVLSPSFTHLGAITKGSKGRGEFHLLSKSGTPFRITRIDARGADFLQFETNTTDFRPTHALNYVYSVTEPGEQSVQVDLAYETEGEASASESHHSKVLNLEFACVGVSSPE